MAADWNGNQVASAPVTVAVVEMHPPTVTVTSPADGIHYTVETLPPLRAEAVDLDGIVTNLTLELDGVVLGETNGSTLELPATNILGGWHTVLARATDNDGLTTASTRVSFFIERSVDANLPVPAQLAAQAAVRHGNPADLAAVAHQHARQQRARGKMEPRPVRLDRNWQGFDR